MKDAEILEREAVAARRLANIAKHKPMTDDEWDQIDKCIRDACVMPAEVVKFHLSFVTPLFDWLRRCDTEAQYWKQRALEAEASLPPQEKPE